MRWMAIGLQAVAASLVAAFLAALCTAAAGAQTLDARDPLRARETGSGPAAHRFEPAVRVPMRDGVTLSTDIYLPEGPGPFPVILIRTPYNKNTFRPPSVSTPLGPAITRTAPPPRGQAGQPAAFFTSHGYAVVIQDFRGRYESEGAFQTAKFERRDFEDTMRWLDEQPWSARRVGMWGCSYPGHAQVVAASTGVSSLRTITPFSAAGSFSSGVGRYTMLWHYSGGAREHMNMLDWYASPGMANLYLKPDPAIDPALWARFAHLYSPIANFSADIGALADGLPIVGLLDRAGLPPTDWNTVMSNPPESPYWYKDSELLQSSDRIHTPALWFYNWNDVHSSEAIAAFEFAKRRGATAEARENQFLVMGPGGHCGFSRLASKQRFGDVDLGDTRLDVWGLLLRWNDRWLKGEKNALDGLPRVVYWLYGRNEWRTAADMPVPGTRIERVYLDAGPKGAATGSGDGALSDAPPTRARSDAFVYDPANPVPTPIEDAGRWTVPMTDQRAVETRPDVLVYSTPPLREGVTVVGSIGAVLYVRSDAPDTDITAKLLDVHPDGRAIQLQTGVLRLRYRNGFRAPELMQPGQVYRIEVDMNATANWFAPGHRIRVEISSSNFPRFDRNLNTGGDNVTETAFRIARNEVLTGPNTPSHILLPVLRER